MFGLAEFGLSDAVYFVLDVHAAIQLEFSLDQLRLELLGVLGQAIVVDLTGLDVEAVRHALEKYRGRTDLFLCCEKPVRQVPAVGQVQAHDTVVWVQQRGVDLKVSWAAG